MDMAHQLFRRCVKCPDETPACPPCAADETCTLISSSCTSCASTVCTKVSAPPPKHSTPGGVIAGGVVGGIFVIALATFLVWRFLIRDKRKAWDQQVSAEESVEKSENSGLQRTGTIRSTRSAHSIASTVLTRASNVIQIAYIPGVTNRSPPDTPGLLVPPVPPLPLATVNSAASTPNYTQDQHFFLPGDIRDSRWSGYSDMTRASISPSLARSSVATTIYRDNAIISPVPAQQALRGKASVVSVRSGSSTPSGEGTPVLESMPPLPLNARAIAASQSKIVGRAMQARPIQVRRTSPANRVPTMANLKARAEQERDSPLSRLDSASEDSSSDEESPIDKQAKSSGGSSGKNTSSDVVSSSGSQPGSSKDSSGNASHRHQKSDSENLQMLIEAAMHRASTVPTSVKLAALAEAKTSSEGPFSDANEVKEA